MAQQKSEDRVVLEGGVMPVELAGSSPGGQGKAIPVDQTTVQLELPIVTAEHHTGSRTGPGMGRVVEPKAIVNAEIGIVVTMEEVAKRLTAALLKVVLNKGAPGPDGQTVGELREQWSAEGPKLAADLLAGTYRPGVIRRAMIPKAGGRQRGLGIPNVIDRVVCEAVRQVLEPCWEPTFHPSSHGFRPGRSCHTAITEAMQHLQDGHGWVVDIDLEKFFDRVCHQRLMAKLAQRVGDRRLLVLIGRLLKAKVVLPDGVVIGNEQGVPQGALVGSARGAWAARHVLARLAWFPPAATSNRACGSPAHGSLTFFTAGIQRPVRHGRLGRGATMVPPRSISPMRSGD